MNVRPGVACACLMASLCLAGDGIPPRGSANDYPAHEVSGKVAVGAALVPPAQVKKIFGEDLDKHGYVVFEVGMFPVDGTEANVTPDDFRLRQGKEGSITRAATPQMIATDVYGPHSPDTSVPGKVHTTETVGVMTGSGGRTTVYTGTQVSVGNPPANYPPPDYPPPGTYPPGRYPPGGYPPSTPPPQSAPRSSGSPGTALEMQIADKSLPDMRTDKAVAGYVFFPKPTGDKKADYELMYMGADRQVSLTLAPRK
jgi:hypothetical protein